MSYPYEDLDDSQFESLVVQCARKLFGMGVQSFAAGPDGGRDARFEGTAERFPSSTGPWTGVTIFQAKHTNAINTHYSDKVFSGDAATSVLSHEIQRVSALATAGELDNYMLFSNRRLGANAASGIKKRIASQTGIDGSFIHLAGIEYLDELLHQHPDIPKLARIDPIDGPLLVSSYEIAEVIYAVAEEMKSSLPTSDAPVVKRVSYSQKNQTNKMSASFANYLAKKYIMYTRQIEDFLANPENSEMLRYYEGAVDEFQLNIIAKRKHYQSFDELFNHLIKVLINRDGVLSRNKHLLRAMIFYMYWHCDIGESTDADT